MKHNKMETALILAKERGLLRPVELDAYDIPREYLRRLCGRGLLQRIGWGLYAPSDASVTEHHSLAEAAKRVPHGVICLLSALSFHGMTTQIPSQVWLAVDRKSRLPGPSRLSLRIVRFSGAALDYGTEEHVVEGVLLRVYSPAKTVADCFKYRNKIGLDVALEALRDCWRQRRATIDQLMDAAEVCRVAKVMRPYLESLA
jgi:predicted transcriptional regulator of viral defense system